MLQAVITAPFEQFVVAGQNLSQTLSTTVSGLEFRMHLCAALVLRKFLQPKQPCWCTLSTIEIDYSYIFTQHRHWVGVLQFRPLLYLEMFRPCATFGRRNKVHTRLDLQYLEVTAFESSRTHPSGAQSWILSGISSTKARTYHVRCTTCMVHVSTAAVHRLHFIMAAPNWQCGTIQTFAKYCRAADCQEGRVNTPCTIVCNGCIDGRQCLLCEIRRKAFVRVSCNRTGSLLTKFNRFRTITFERSIHPSRAPYSRMPTRNE